MKIFIVGLPGSGKSTLGRELSETLKIPFVDLDAEIEAIAGKDIKTIFKEQGEDHFRKIESECLQKWAKSQGEFVMATGGGAPCFSNNMQMINQSGKSIFLDVPPMEIVRRINRTERAERPLLGRVHPDELKDHIQSMRTRRLAFYNQAHIVLTGVKITGKELKDRISA